MNRRLILIAGVSILMLLPVLAVFPISLNPDRYPVLWPESPTLRWYAALLVNKQWAMALSHSVLLAALASSVTLVMAFPAAWFLSRRSLRALSWAAPLLMLPVALPPVALAVGLFKCLSWVSLVDHLLGFLFAHVLITMPFAVLVLFSAISKVNPMVLPVAQICGASLPVAFFRVILPQVRPAAVRAWLLCFFISMDETVIALYLAGTRFETLPKR
ncbi:ABC transporter permease, partial [Planctomycetota bacterium]